MVAADAIGADDVVALDPVLSSNVNSRSLAFAAGVLGRESFVCLRAGLVLTVCGVATGVTGTRARRA